MQQAIYNTTLNTTAINPTAVRSTTLARTAKLGAGWVRWIARKWEMVGVLTLMGSSAAYGVFALAHTGL